jgi:glycopeptide antibiotics resistance protein
LSIIHSKRRWPWWLLVTATAGWLLWMTLNPEGHLPIRKLNLIPLVEQGWALTCLFNSTCAYHRSAFWFLLINLLGNIVVFVPLGFGLAGALNRNRLSVAVGGAVLGGFALSLMIELLQLTLPSRATDIDDLIFNTLGAAIGAAGYALLSKGYSQVWTRHQP